MKMRRKGDADGNGGNIKKRRMERKTRYRQRERK